MSSKTEFLEYLSERVDHYVSEYAVSKGKAFTIWYGVEALGMDEDAAYEASQADGGMDKGIDFFYIDEEHQRVVILQGKFRKKGNYVPKPGEMYELLHTTDWLEDPEALAREGREDLASAAEDYLEAIENEYSTELVFAYVGAANRDVNDVAEKFNQDNAGASPTRLCRVVALESLIASHKERVEATRVPKATMQLQPDEWFKSGGSFGKSLVATAQGRELKRLYVEHGEALFDRNIRLFLGTRKGGVNDGMRDTLHSPKHRKNFWAYNNGITIVCDSFVLDESESKLMLKNFSIVNGCQTTTSLGNASATAVKDANLIVRVIQAVDPVIDDVIRFNNSQTPIRIWEFSSQDPLQRKLKGQLADSPRPFLYLLRKPIRAGELTGRSTTLYWSGQSVSIWVIHPEPPVRELTNSTTLHRSWALPTARATSSFVSGYNW